MYMWFGYNLGDFLLTGYNVITIPSFFCTCLGLFALSILYEAMKILQIRLHQRATVFGRRKNSGISEMSCLLSKISSESIRMRVSRHCSLWCSWSFQAFHWFIHTFLGYLLMLSVMSFNVYIILAIAFGSCIGYWIFGPKLIELNIKRFYERQRFLDCDKECADNIANGQRHGSTVSIVADQVESETTVDVHAPVQA